MFTVGYIGVDCSLSSSVAPNITAVRSGPVCDARGPDRCRFVLLYLTGFSLVRTFTCKFVRWTDYASFSVILVIQIDLVLVFI